MEVIEVRDWMVRKGIGSGALFAAATAAALTYFLLGNSPGPKLLLAGEAAAAAAAASAVASQPPAGDSRSRLARLLAWLGGLVAGESPSGDGSVPAVLPPSPSHGAADPMMPTPRRVMAHSLEALENERRRRLDAEAARDELAAQLEYARSQGHQRETSLLMRIHELTTQLASERACVETYKEVVSSLSLQLDQSIKAHGENSQFLSSSEDSDGSLSSTLQGSSTLSKDKEEPSSKEYASASADAIPRPRSRASDRARSAHNSYTLL